MNNNRAVITRTQKQLDLAKYTHTQKDTIMDRGQWWQQKKDINSMINSHIHPFLIRPVF